MASHAAQGFLAVTHGMIMASSIYYYYYYYYYYYPLLLLLLLIASPPVVAPAPFGSVWGVERMPMPNDEAAWCCGRRSSASGHAVAHIQEEPG